MPHISRDFEDELSRLKDYLLMMGGMIESMLEEAHQSLLTGKTDLAEQVIQRDEQLDQLEKKVDEMAIQILARRQPTATDLRFVVSCLKICTDLERMGDLIVNLCERICDIAESEKNFDASKLSEIFTASSQMVARSLDAFVHLSLEAAGQVLTSDKRVDLACTEVFEIYIERMKAHEESVVVGLKVCLIAKYLERIADHATNIAEQVVFIVRGLDIRHSGSLRPTAIL